MTTVRIRRWRTLTKGLGAALARPLEPTAGARNGVDTDVVEGAAHLSEGIDLQVASLLVSEDACEAELHAAGVPQTFTADPIGSKIVDTSCGTLPSLGGSTSAKGLRARRCSNTADRDGTNRMAVVTRHLFCCDVLG
jgi:hypothetical protein